MHILFICAEYPVAGRPTGGFGRYVENIVKGLIEAGHAVSIICQGNIYKEYHEADLTITVIPGLCAHFFDSLKRSSLSSLRRIGNFGTYPLGFGWGVKNEIKKINLNRKIDIIESGEFGGELFFHLLFRKKTIAKVIIKLHTPTFLIQEFNGEKPTFFHTFMNYLERFCLHHADGVYSPTKALATLVRKRWHIVINEIIPYPSLSLPLRLNRKISSLRILYGGKLQTKKGVFVLADAVGTIIKFLPKTQFLIMGPDTQENGKSVTAKLKSQLDPLIQKHQIFFSKAGTRSEFYKQLRQATLVVVPSLWENYPNIIIEAMALGVPVVATDVGGISEMIIHKRDGWLVKSGSSLQLSRAIIKLLKNPKLREKIALSAHSRVTKKLSLHDISRKTIIFYESILKGNKVV